MDYRGIVTNTAYRPKETPIKNHRSNHIPRPSESWETLCFVKVDTDEGIHGWGECYTQSDRDMQVMAHVDQLERYLVGRGPLNIKHFTQMAYDDVASRRGAMDFYCAISGLAQAIWDITGKKLGVPVH